MAGPLEEGQRYALPSSCVSRVVAGFALDSRREFTGAAGWRLASADEYSDELYAGRRPTCGQSTMPRWQRCSTLETMSPSKVASPTSPCAGQPSVDRMVGKAFPAHRRLLPPGSDLRRIMAFLTQGVAWAAIRGRPLPRRIVVGGRSGR